MMKFARFTDGQQVYNGRVDGDKLVVLVGDFFSDDFTETEQTFELSQVKLLAPVQPGKIVCIGKNYLAHVQEMSAPDTEAPTVPMIFLVPTSAVIGPEEYIEILDPNHVTHHEAELVVVIGKEGRNIPVEESLDYVLGYTCGNDVSDRTIMKEDDLQISRSKSYHTFKPLGPFIATELDPANLQVQCRVNGETKQNGRTSQLIKNVAKLISLVSGIMTLQPGDLIFTGTPAGVGNIKPGDVCEIEIEGIGILRNPVK